jgi:hypothetical protein
MIAAAADAVAGMSDATTLGAPLLPSSAARGWRGASEIEVKRPPA